MSESSTETPTRPKEIPTRPKGRPPGRPTRPKGKTLEVTSGSKGKPTGLMRPTSSGTRVDDEVGIFYGRWDIFVGERTTPLVSNVLLCESPFH